MTMPSEESPVRVKLAFGPDALRLGLVEVVELGKSEEGYPREAMLTMAVDGPRAYRNMCPHLPVPIDGGSRRFFEGAHFICGTHGALFEIRTGRCVEGPPAGQCLIRYDLEVEDGVFVLIDTGDASIRECRP